MIKNLIKYCLNVNGFVVIKENSIGLKFGREEIQEKLAAISKILLVREVRLRDLSSAQLFFVISQK